jgi:hypothetical protein
MIIVFRNAPLSPVKYASSRGGVDESDMMRTSTRTDTLITAQQDSDGVQMMGELTWTTVPNPRTGTSFSTRTSASGRFPTSSVLFVDDADDPGMGEEQRGRKCDQSGGS